MVFEKYEQLGSGVQFLLEKPFKVVVYGFTAKVNKNKNHRFEPNDFVFAI